MTDQLDAKVNDLTVKSEADPAAVEDDDQIVNPWEVVSKSEKGVDYDKLISKFLQTIRIRTDTPEWLKKQISPEILSILGQLWNQKYLSVAENMRWLMSNPI